MQLITGRGVNRSLKILVCNVTGGGRVRLFVTCECVRSLVRTGHRRACLGRWWIAAHRRSLSKLSFDCRYLASLDARRWCPVILGRHSRCVHLGEWISDEWHSIALPLAFAAAAFSRGSAREKLSSDERAPRVCLARTHARTHLFTIRTRSDR